ncbi:hypothetical protein [Sansalvadorimonas verongulae]|uniref:hypothetical protein n=1 Tax=Sansalvadorimonas verongulae TaxID=2172824 RepID=UPI0012BD23B8|nr:hypothetical protein [Sansalvadorimonas verongulae]MTI15588.1 hypothetical protein [Sansalvadorimonas verongulae]
MSGNLKRFHAHAVYIVALLLSSLSAYSAEEHRIEVVVPHFLFKLEEQRINTQQNRLTITYQRSHIPSMEHEAYMLQSVPDAHRPAAVSQLVSDGTSDISMSLPIHEEFYGFSMNYQDQESRSNRVMLIVNSDFGDGNSPLAAVNRSLLQQESEASEGVVLPFSQLYFAYRLDDARPGSSADSNDMTVVDMLGAEKQDLELIRRHWLTKLVVHFAKHFELKEGLAPSSHDRSFSIIATGKIDKSKNCFLSFQAVESRCAPDSSDLMLIFEPKEETVYDNTIESFEPKFLVLGRNPEKADQVMVKVRKWSSGKLVTDDSDGMLSLDQKVHATSPFFVKGWHDPHFEIQDGPFEFTYSPSDLPWTVVINDAESMDIEAHEHRRWRSPELNPSRVERKNSPATPPSISPPFLLSLSGYGVQGPASDTLSFQETWSDKSTPQPPGSPLHGQNVQVLSLRSAVEHIVFHTEENPFGDWTTEDDIKTVFKHMEKVVAQRAGELRQYKSVTGGRIKRGNPILRLEEITEEVRNDISQKKGLRPLLSALNTHREQILHLGMVRSSQCCLHCTGEASGELLPYLKLDDKGSLR